MVDDERGAVFGEDVLKEPVEKDISVHFLHRFAIIPGRGPDKTVIRPLVPPVEEVASEPVLQATERFDTLHDVCHGDPFAEILKQPIGE